jgi:hypothetical protein
VTSVLNLRGEADCHDLRTAELPFEEWEVLFRKELLLERRSTTSRRLHALDGGKHELPSRH